MYLTGKNKEVWQIDESLKVIASELVEKYPGKVDHVLLKRVVFVRCIDANQKDWLGKCWYLRPPINIVPFYAVTMFNKEKYDENYAQEIHGNNDCFYDYIIGINDKVIMETADPDRVTEATILHEMLHINDGMDGIRNHDIKDFKEMIDEFGTSYTSGYFKNMRIEESS